MFWVVGWVVAIVIKQKGEESRQDSRKIHKKTRQITMCEGRKEALKRKGRSSICKQNYNKGKVPAHKSYVTVTVKVTKQFT